MTDDDWNEKWELFWVLVVGIVLVCLSVALVGGFLYFYVWGILKVAGAVLSALVSGIVTVIHAVKS